MFRLIFDTISEIGGTTRKTPVFAQVQFSMGSSSVHNGMGHS